MQSERETRGPFVTSAVIAYSPERASEWEAGWIANYYCRGCEALSYWWAGPRPESEPCPGCGQTGLLVLTLGSQPLTLR